MLGQHGLQPDAREERLHLRAPLAALEHFPDAPLRALGMAHAIAALGARKDGVIRHHHPRRDGSVRDTVMFSILATEWSDVKRHLLTRLARQPGPGSTR